MPPRVVRWVGARVERPIDLGEVLKGLAAILLVVAVLISLRIVLADKAADRDRFENEIAELRSELDERDETSACRAGLAAGVTDAETTYLLAIGRLVEHLPGDDRSAVAGALAELSRSADLLDEARDARVAFEENPEPCPS